MGDVHQPEKLQIGNDASISEQTAKTTKIKKRRSKWLILIVVAIIGSPALVPVINWLRDSHSKEQGVSLQKNVTMSPEVETKGNHSPAIVNSPNSTFNMNTYIIPNQSETRSEVNGIDANQPK